jgi:hypothetical protein
VQVHSWRDLRLLEYNGYDMADDVDGSKGTTGVLFVLGGSPITWQSQKQKVVALSSCEAEYIAATTAACQGVWLDRLLLDLLESGGAVASILMDNKSTI